MKTKQYPKGYISWTSGCKVGWITYDDKQKAEKCSEIAKHNANILLAYGFDFGYQFPGAILETEEGYKVTIP